MSLLLEINRTGRRRHLPLELMTLQRPAAEPPDAGEIVDGRQTGRCPRCGFALDCDGESGRCRRVGCGFAF